MPVPKLRFKNDLSQDYPEWKVSKLGELFNVSAGGDIDGNNVRAIKTQDFCYPVYANALKNKGLYGYSNTYKIDGESFTITGRGDVGVAVSRHCNYTPIVRLLVCKPLHNENVDFFAECFNKTKVFIESTGVPQLTAPQVKNIKITYPSLSEQEKIADFLTSYDHMIDTQSQRVEAMKTRKKGLLQKIFSQEIRFRDDEGREYPEWEGKYLEKIASIYDGVHQTPNYVETGVPFVSVENINDLENTNKFISLEDFKKDFKVYPEQDDILMTRIGDIGTSALVTKEGFAYYVSLALIKTKKNAIIPKFLNQYIKSNIFQHELYKRSLQYAFPKKINKGEIGKCVVKVPSLPEQQKIADFLTAIDTQIEVEEKRLETMKTIKKGLLQQMFI